MASKEDEVSLLSMAWLIQPWSPLPRCPPAPCKKSCCPVGPFPASISRKKNLFWHCNRACSWTILLCFHSPQKLIFLIYEGLPVKRETPKQSYWNLPSSKFRSDDIVTTPQGSVWHKIAKIFPKALGNSRGTSEPCSTRLALSALSLSAGLNWACLFPQELLLIPLLVMIIQY